MTYEDRVREIVRNYLKGNIHRDSAARIYKQIAGSNIEFNQWDDVEEEFADLSWDSDRMEEFVQRCKQMVEKGESKISETYFDIIEPTSITTDEVCSELDREEYNPEETGVEKEGFEYTVDGNGNITGRYIYVDIDDELTFDGELRQPLSEGFFEFEVVPEDSLLIIKSTSLTDVQKSRRYFGDKTNLETLVSADYTTHHDEAVDRINGFLNSFEDGPQETGDDPGLLHIEEISLHDPHDNVDSESEEEPPQIENIAFDGHDLGNAPEVEEHLEDGWIIKKLVAPVHFRNDYFKVTVGVNSIMSYGKVSGSGDYEKTRELSQLVREFFDTHLRIRS